MQKQISKLPPHAMIYNKLCALFKADQDFDFDLNDSTRTITISSANRRKLDTLKAALNLEAFKKLKTKVKFECTAESEAADFLRDAFTGNPHFSRAYVTYEAGTGVQHTICYFKDETIQYGVDDRFVLHGYETSLAERLIKELFCKDVRHMKYITEEKTEDFCENDCAIYKVVHSYDEDEPCEDQEASNKTNVGVMDPYAVLYNKIQALFGDDPDLEISALDDGSRSATITSTNKYKVEALNKAFNFELFKSRGFNLEVKYTGEDSEDVESIKTLFAGNPHFSRVYVTYDSMGGVRTVLCYFKNETIQYSADDRFVPHGYETSLAQDLVLELFNEKFLGWKCLTEEKSDCMYTVDEERSLNEYEYPDCDSNMYPTCGMECPCSMPCEEPCNK